MQPDFAGTRALQPILRPVPPPWDVFVGDQKMDASLSRRSAIVVVIFVFSVCSLEVYHISNKLIQRDCVPQYTLFSCILACTQHCGPCVCKRVNRVLVAMFVFSLWNAKPWRPCSTCPWTRNRWWMVCAWPFRLKSGKKCTSAGARTWRAKRTLVVFFRLLVLVTWNNRFILHWRVL